MISLHRYEEALAQFEKVLRMDKDNLDSWNSKTEVFIHLGLYIESLEANNKALEIDPNSQVSLDNRKKIKESFEHRSNEILKLLKQGNIKYFNKITEQLVLNLDLKSVDLKDVNLKSANLRYADLESADLSGANLESADLSRANLKNVNLRETKLYFTKLSNTNLSYANLTNAYMLETNLSDANLTGANLSFVNSKLLEQEFASYDAKFYANLSGSNISNIDLRGAKLTHTISINTTLFEGFTIDKETDFSNAIIDNSLFIKSLKQFTKNIPKEIKDEGDLD
jgi:uncharacterized protein YjbI with pentapeptide repeats